MGTSSKDPNERKIISVRVIIKWFRTLKKKWSNNCVKILKTMGKCGKPPEKIETMNVEKVFVLF